jgi:ABC-type nickel/cobalt efflux system permease component RcnA
MNRVARAVSNMNPFLRGMAIVALIAVVVVVLQLQATLAALFLLARIAFFLAIAFFLYMVWRERRGEIDMWNRRAQWVFYGAAALLVADVAWFVVGGGHQGLDALAFVVVLVLGAFALWRTWRDQHTYG